MKQMFALFLKATKTVTDKASWELGDSNFKSFMILRMKRMTNFQFGQSIFVFSLQF